MANAIPTDLTTVSDFKQSQNVSGTADDAWIQQLITRSTAWIEGLTSRKFVARQYNGATGTDGTATHPTTRVPDENYVYFDGDPTLIEPNARSPYWGTGLFYLPQYPVQANTVLTFQLAVLQSRDDVSTTGDVWDTTGLKEGRDYLVDRTTGALRMFTGPFQAGVKNYRVKMAAGYMLPAATPAAPWVPTDLQQLCIEMANLIYRGSKNLKSESIGPWNRTFETQKEDPYIASVLAAYTRVIL